MWGKIGAETVDVRRFTETTYSWNNMRKLGTPTDSYGMNYTIPVAMASLERFAGIPLFVGELLPLRSIALGLTLISSQCHRYSSLLW